jgi:hypothetical protein
LKRAREIGFVQHDKGVANGLRNLFNQDWSQAAAVPSRDPSERCQSF